MKKRKLGNQGLEVSEIGLGCMGMSDFYKTKEYNENESIDLIKKAYDFGIDFYDTADMYGPFKNEILVGKALKEIRDKVIIATKFGNERKEDGTFVGVNGKKEYVKKACENSLKRLNTDYIDLYYQHRVDRTVPIEETFTAMSELVKEGKVRYLGISEASKETIIKANKVHPISVLQTEYSLWTRDVEKEIFPTIESLNIGFVAYSPLGRGFLTGKIQKFEDLPQDDFRRHSPRFMGDNFEKNLEILKKVQEFAQQRNVKPSQVALAWVLSKKKYIVPIPGTKQLEYLKENIDAVNIELTQKDIETLDNIFPIGITSGERYADMSTVNG